MAKQSKSKAIERPLRRLTTKQLVAGLESPDVAFTVETVTGPVAVTFPLAFAEANARLDHANTLQPQNRRMISAALIAADGFIEIAPEPEVAPEVAPEVKAAAAAFSERVKKLAPAGTRIKLAIRARKLAQREGFTDEDVEALSDEDCIDLVDEPIR